MSSPPPTQGSHPRTSAQSSGESSLAKLTVDGFIDSLGAKQPTPGGGAAAPVVLALAASLGRMVAAYSQGKKKLAEHESMLAASIKSLQSHARAALQLADRDAAAYATLNELGRLPENDDRRVREWGAAVAAAIDTPRAVMAACEQVLQQLDQLVGRSNAMLASDLAIAAILADAAARAAAWNVRINLPQVNDEALVEQYQSEMNATLQQTHTLAIRIEETCG